MVITNPSITVTELATSADTEKRILGLVTPGTFYEAGH